MHTIPFAKMSGTGNDFIVIDNRDGRVDDDRLTEFIQKVCRRKMSVGADGLILIESCDNADFRWRFYNSDGSLAEMCGNGARCAARFAFLNGIAGENLSFETDAGIINGQVMDGGAKVKIPDPADLRLNYAIDLESGPLTVSSINTGVPHVVVLQDNVDDVDVFGLGRQIRYHETFAPAGTNVNFICQQKTGHLAIRTYERGVENETLAKSNDILKFIGLEEKAMAEAKNLPYGEQRLLEIGIALAATPKILLLDEPSAGLNEVETWEMMDLIKRIQDTGITILLVEHDMKLVMGISDRIIVLNFGVKIAEGTPAAVMSNPKVITAYLGERRE